MKKIRTLAVLNAVAFVVQLAVSWLAQAKLITNYNVGQISDKYPSLFTPAGITFAIWGVIYVSLAAFCIYHVVMAWTRTATNPANKDTERIGGWFILNNVATSFWLITWTNELLFLAVFFIFLQLLCLIAIHQRLGMYDTKRGAGSKWLTQFPLSIYFGWITIASMANASSYLNASSWDGWGLDPIDWTNILIGVAVFITILVMTVRRNVFFGLAIIWGLYGIILKRMSADSALYFPIERTAWIGISLLGLVALLRIARNRLSIKHEESFPVAHHPVK